MNNLELMALYCEIESEVPSTATCDEIDAEIGRRCGLTRAQVSARIDETLHCKARPACTLEAV